MQKLILIPLLFALCACGKFSRIQPNETSVTFSVSGRNGPAAVLSGIMVYAIRVGNPKSKGAKFLANESAASGWLIPNGNYDFLAFGYTGSDITGTMYCGSAPNTALSGGSTTVNLVLDDTGICGTPPFSPTGFGAGNSPYTLNVAACDPGDGDLAAVSLPSTTCGSGAAPSQGNIETLRISFPEVSLWDPNQPPAGAGPGMVSACRTGPYNGGSTPTGIKVPAGPFIVQIEAYSMSACSGFMGSYTMLNGIVGAADNQSVRFVNSSNQHFVPSILTVKPAPYSTTSYLFLRAPL